MNPGKNEKIDQKFSAILEAAERRRKAFTETPVPKIHIGMATCGIASGALETKKAFEEILAERNVEAIIHPVGCIGHCYAEPVVSSIIQIPDFPPFSIPKLPQAKPKCW